MLFRIVFISKATTPVVPPVVPPDVDTVTLNTMHQEHQDEVSDDDDEEVDDDEMEEEEEDEGSDGVFDGSVFG
jgi:hypothetical protein